MYFRFQWHFTGNVKGHWGYRRTCCCRSMYDLNSRTKYQGIILILIMQKPLIIYMVIKVRVSTILSDLLIRIFVPQTWTDVSKNSSKTAKNTEKWFSRNISGETCTQALFVWATLIQVNQDNPASVWWTAHALNRFETALVVYKLKLLHKWLIIWVLIDKLRFYR
jgi:hypothetical protein